MDAEDEVSVSAPSRRALRVAAEARGAGHPACADHQAG